MKKTAQKILLSLYQPETFRLSLKELEFLNENQTASGFKSIVYHLERSGYVRLERLDGEPWVSLTSHGKEAVEDLFPAFHPRHLHWEGTWSCLVFRTAPSTDPEFRYLRKLLVKVNAAALSRGVYLYPGGFPDRVLSEC